MQRQTKEKIVRNFVIFNTAGAIGFLVATVVFAAVILYIDNPTAAWLLGSLIGTLVHFGLNHVAMTYNPKRQTTTN